MIGNAAYENVIPLKNPTNDAADMCAALQKLGFQTLCHTNVRDRAEFDARVTEYVSQLRENSVSVFYYSGHGVQAGNANYLIPTQVQIRSATENPTRALYAVDDLFERLGKKATRFQFVVLDACRADLFAPPARRGTRSTLVRALENAGGASVGLQPITHAPPGTMVLFATASKDTAYDGDGRNGTLTKHMLENIGTRALTIESFVKLVTLGVELETLQKFRKRQTPYTYGSFTGEFCFAGCQGEKMGPFPPAH